MTLNRKREAERFISPEMMHCSFLVMIFLQAHDRWFRDPGNSLFGWRDHCDKYLRLWVDEGELPEPSGSIQQRSAEAYVGMKFLEWVAGSWVAVPPATVVPLPKCIGINAANPCGYEGGKSGDTCPQCGGMVLSEAALDRADRAAVLWWLQEHRSHLIDDYPGEWLAVSAEGLQGHGRRLSLLKDAMSAAGKSVQYVRVGTHLTADWPVGMAMLRPTVGQPGLRKVLLLASYCGEDNPACTDDKPCPDCLQMCNVMEVEVPAGPAVQFDQQ